MSRLRLGLVLVLLLTFIAISIHAQDTEPAPRYRLRVHTPQTFVEALEHPAKLRLSASEKATYIQAADAEFWVRYADNATYEQIALTFDMLRWRPRDIAEIDYNRWVALLVQRWIDTHPIDFASLTHLEFADIKADITSHDFDADGQPEWILYLAKGTAELEYENNVVVQRAGDGYRVIPVPIAWYSDATREAWAGQRVGAGIFEDVNADGVEEWLFHRSAIATMPAVGVSVNSFRNILSWHDGHLVELGPIEGDADAENIDDDASQEFVIRQSVTDNWGCGTQEVIVYDWADTRYVRLPSHYEPLDCTTRRAEEAIPTAYPFNPSPTPDTRPQEEIWRDYHRVADAYLVSNFALVLEIAQTAMGSNDEYVDFDEMRYFRALALEALNRSDEALAEYVAIIEAAPESAWGRLAALHVEAVE